MRARLGESLRYIARSIDGQIPFSMTALEGFLGRVSSGPVSPLVFGAYCDLVLALDADDAATAERTLAEITAAGNHPGGPAVVALADPQSDPAANRYARIIDSDPSIPLRLYPPTPEAAKAAGAQIAAAFALMDKGHPELAAEIRALLREIVLAVGPDDPKALTFDGASAFLLWGGIILNAHSNSAVLDMVQALAHESGHNVLFGLCADGSLVENDDAAIYESPLRRDRRPMDGLVHATYVCARMHEAVAHLREAGALPEDALHAAANALASNARAFSSGMETIDRHAKLTPLGHDIMEGARAYMAAGDSKCAGPRYSP